jgi:hypothetical protein
MRHLVCTGIIDKRDLTKQQKDKNITGDAIHVAAKTEGKQ